MSRHSKKPVDMSLPPESRGRRRRHRTGGTPLAQMGHARGSRAARVRRDGERWLEVEARLREDAARFAGEITELDEEGFIARVMSRIREDRD